MFVDAITPNPNLASTIRNIKARIVRPRASQNTNITVPISHINSAEPYTLNNFFCLILLLLVLVAFVNQQQARAVS